MSHFEIKSPAAALMAQARSVSGVEITDVAIAKPLERLLYSLNNEARLSQWGAKGMEARLLRLLSNRLRMQRDLLRHPEIENQKIISPLLLTGAARTGSTKLQKMLAASGDFLFLRCWQVLCPSLITGDVSENPGPRIVEADEETRGFNDHAPQARLIHQYSTFEPEEETLLFEHNLFAPFLTSYVHIPTFTQWYMEHRDVRAEIEFVVRMLKYIQWQFYDGDSRPWLLKTPIYNGCEPLLAEYFPDACFVATHREPVSMLSSGTSLFSAFRKAYSDAEYNEAIGPMLLEGHAAGMQHYLTVRSAHPELNLLDVGYSQLTQNADEVVNQVYAHAGMRAGNKAKLSMRNWERENCQHKLGVHRHRLEDFSLTREMVESRFSAYTERFARLL